MNVLDLGSFSAIQALQQQVRAKNLDELVSLVVYSFAELSVETLENIFYTLPACMEQVMLDAGSNNYKIPHLKKANVRKVSGQLPSSYKCSLLAELALAEFDSFMS